MVLIKWYNIVTAFFAIDPGFISTDNSNLIVVFIQGCFQAKFSSAFFSIYLVLIRPFLRRPDQSPGKTAAVGCSCSNLWRLTFVFARKPVSNKQSIFFTVVADLHFVSRRMRLCAAKPCLILYLTAPCLILKFDLLVSAWMISLHLKKFFFNLNLILRCNWGCITLVRKMRGNWQLGNTNWFITVKLKEETYLK